MVFNHQAANFTTIGTTIISKAMNMTPIMHIFFLFADLWCSTPCYKSSPAYLTFDLAVSTLSYI